MRRQRDQRPERIPRGRAVSDQFPLLPDRRRGRRRRGEDHRRELRRERGPPHDHPHAGRRLVDHARFDVRAEPVPDGILPSGITPSRGGILDDRIYFIDDGTTVAADCSTATSRAVAEQLPGPCHPQLVYADWVYASGETSAQAFTSATITPVADDIEDLQVAYGMDFYDATANTGSLASPAPARVSNISGIKNLFPSDGSISVTTQSAFNAIVAAARSATAPNQDPSEDASAADKDEWIGNVAGEPATGTFNALSDLSRLKALQISILAKGTQPDPTGRSRKSTSTVNVAAYPGAFSYPLMDSLARTVSQPTTASSTAYPFRRRATALRVDLRNFQIQ